MTEYGWESFELRLAGHVARAKLFVIMFEKLYWPIGPFESWQAADEYGMTVIERSFNSGDSERDEWKIRPLQLPKGVLVRAKGQ